MTEHQILVGNIGLVLSTDCAEEARRTFEEYANMSANNYGRCAGEGVVWMTNTENCYEIVQERIGDNENE